MRTHVVLYFALALILTSTTIVAQESGDTDTPKENAAPILPWTAEDAKAFFKEGMSFTYGHGFGDLGLRTTHRVTAVDAEKVSLSVSTLASDRTEEKTFANIANPASYPHPLGADTTKVSDEKLEVKAGTFDCIKFEYTKDIPNVTNDVTQRITVWYIKNKPSIYAKIVADAGEFGKTTTELMEVKEPREKIQLPFTVADAKRTLVKGLKLKYTGTNSGTKTTLVQEVISADATGVSLKTTLTRGESTNVSESTRTFADLCNPSKYGMNSDDSRTSQSTETLTIDGKEYPSDLFVIETLREGKAVATTRVWFPKSLPGVFAKMTSSSALSPDSSSELVLTKIAQPEEKATEKPAEKPADETE